MPLETDVSSQSTGAPETVSVGNDVLQTVDTWSFGCILSVMATWIVSGPDGVSEYEQRRYQASKESSRAGYPTDTFHDGEDVFPVIKVWHERLKRTRRRSDNITNQILDIVDDCLLTKDAQARLTSHQLREWLETSLGLRSDGDDRVNDELDDANLTGLLSTILGPNPEPPNMPGVELRSPTPNIQATTDSATPNLSSHDFEGRIQTLDTLSRLGGVPSVDSAPDLSRPGVPRLTNTPAPAPDPLVPVVSSTEEEIMYHAWEAVRTANHGALALRRHLFRENPWIADRVDEDGCTPIMIAARNNNLEVVNLLVEDSDVSRRDKNQRTVLHHLIWAQHGTKQTSQFVDTLEYIIGSESSSESIFSSVTWPDRTTCTPIIAAAKEKHLDAIKLLVEHSDLSLCDKDEKTVLHHLIGAQRGVDETPEFMATLRRILGPNPPPRHIFDLINHPDHLQCTCLALCVSIGKMPRTIRELLRKGAFVVDGESGTGHSPLAKAVALQTPTLVQVMLEEGLLDHDVPAELRSMLKKTKKEAPTIWRLVKDRVRDAEPPKSSRSILRIGRRSK
jgi:ankyrin repeat protein